MIVKLELELNQERTMAEIELELDQQSTLALELTRNVIEEQKK